MQSPLETLVSAQQESSSFTRANGFNSSGMRDSQPFLMYVHRLDSIGSLPDSVFSSSSVTTGCNGV